MHRLGTPAARTRTFSKFAPHLGTPVDTMRTPGSLVRTLVAPQVIRVANREQVCDHYRLGSQTRPRERREPDGSVPAGSLTFGGARNARSGEGVLSENSAAPDRASRMAGL